MLLREAGSSVRAAHSFPISVALCGFTFLGALCVKPCLLTPRRTQAMSAIVTGKWNKIEHRLFSFITQISRGKPLVSYQNIVQLIASTTTRTGLNVKCEIDHAGYPVGVKVSDQDMAAICITPHQFHGEWNYTIASQSP
jgi:hypothetical protein